MEQGFDPAKAALGLHGLALLRGLLEEPVLQSFVQLVDTLADPALRPAHGGAAEGGQTLRLYAVDCYCRFVAELYRAGGDFGNHLLGQVLKSENPVARIRAAGGQESARMAASLKSELALFGMLSAVPGYEVARLVVGGHLPGYDTTPHDFGAVYDEQLANVSTRGYGIFAEYHMFTLGQGSTLLPVGNPDPQRLDELTGYERERGQVILNTRALLRGLPANNILLYGDAGTGKSSTVKALANAYRAEGLRLIEVRKNQLYQIPLLMDALAQNPLKFILFIDDLSFPADDGDFTALKAILEGNISARPGNIVVYATSNRRHMMRERFADRAGEDIHRGDTIEEQTSLAARFGLTVTFLKPDRELYGTIVAALAAEYGVALPQNELLARAEAHALRYGGRSPRTAKQFVELEKARQELEGQP